MTLDFGLHFDYFGLLWIALDYFRLCNPRFWIVQSKILEYVWISFGLLGLPWIA